MPPKPLTAAERKRRQRKKDIDLMLNTPPGQLSEDLCLKILRLPVSTQIKHTDQVYAAYMRLGFFRGYLTFSDEK